MTNVIYVGTDGGATTSKVGGVWNDGSTITTKLLQASTNSAHGPESVVHSWVEAVDNYLSQNSLTWDQLAAWGWLSQVPSNATAFLTNPPTCLIVLQALMCILPTAVPCPSVQDVPSH